MSGQNQNGQLVMETLQDLAEPATMTEIVAHIAETAGVSKKLIKPTVQATLAGGVRFGYIQRTGHRYYAAQVESEGEGEMPDIEEPAAPAPEPEQNTPKAAKGEKNSSETSRQRQSRRRHRQI